MKGIDENASKRKMSFETFRSIRAKLAYVAYSTMPDILIYCARMAQYTAKMFESDSSEPLRLLRKACRVMISGPSMNGIVFNTIPMNRMEVIVCTDAAFATNPDKSSQIGLIAMLRDTETKKVNIVHYLSSKTKRICKSALAAELLAMVEGYDVGFSIRESLERMTQRKDIPLHLVSDSFSLYGLVVSLARTTERRLQIDLMMLREAFESREITSVMWISGEKNPADDLTKPDKRNGACQISLSPNSSTQLKFIVSNETKHKSQPEIAIGT